MNKETLLKSGYFRYTDHYTAEPDNIFISTTTTRNRVRILVTTFDNIFKRAEFLLNDKELTMLAHMISLAWQNHSNSFDCSLDSHSKHIRVYTASSNAKIERHKHMTIKINDKLIAYGLDINDSRRFYKMLAQLINKKGSSELSC